MKTFVLTVSMTFPSTHSKKGRPTNFKEKIYAKEKIHTVRLNYDLWLKRVTQIQNGEAWLSIRQWTGKPYYSQQKELFKLGKHEVGIQKVKYDFRYGLDGQWLVDDEKRIGTWDLCSNDGLDMVDFFEWFSPVPCEPMAIIHFSQFRY